MQSELILPDEGFDTWLHAALDEDREQRRQQRHPFFRYVTISDGERTLDQAFCRDIASDSVGLAHFGAIENEQVDLEIQTEGATFSLPCRLKWQHAYRGDVFLSAGFVYSEALPEFRKLQQMRIPNGAPRRIEKRYPFFRSALIRTCQDGEWRDIDGFTVDISNGGVGFLLREPIEMDRVVHAQVFSHNDWANVVRIRVSWCYPVEHGMYRLGGEAVQSYRDSSGER
ncbi:MAG: hypothetical protein CL681_23680 [Blastopirellula sp.]|nr:hypothetical protein [Blastopirellula sp.]